MMKQISTEISFSCYRFSITKRSTDSQARFALVIDEIEKAYYDMDVHEDGSGTEYPSGSFTTNIQLTAGQVVRVSNRNSAQIFGTDEGLMMSWFTGYMMFFL